MKENTIMTRKHTLLSALALCVLASVAVSCGSDNSGTAETTAAVGGTDTAAVTEGETASDRPALDLPPMDFGGEALRILGYEVGVDCIKQPDFFYDEASAGELINDAIHTRNLMIEERYNCKIEVTVESTPKVTASNAITAGSDDFDITELYINDTMKLAMEGMFLNWYDLDHIKLDQPWWDQAIQRDLAIYDKIYVMTGDISLYDEELNYCVYFNKQVAQNNDVGDLYEMARSKK